LDELNSQHLIGIELLDFIVNQGEYAVAELRDQRVSLSDVLVEPDAALSGLN
jgi:hypothetical protein